MTIHGPAGLDPVDRGIVEVVASEHLIPVIAEDRSQGYALPLENPSDPLEASALQGLHRPRRLADNGRDLFHP